MQLCIHIVSVTVCTSLHISQGNADKFRIFISGNSTLPELYFPATTAIFPCLEGRDKSFYFYNLGGRKLSQSHHLGHIPFFLTPLLTKDYKMVIDNGIHVIYSLMLVFDVVDMVPLGG